MKKQPYHKEDYIVPLYRTFPEFLDGMDATFGDRPALSWFTRREEEKGYTYHEMVERVRALRESLCRRQMSKAHIAIVSENSAEWILAFLAAAACGSTAVCVDGEQSDESIRDMLRRAEVRMVFLSQTYLDICKPLLQEGCVEEIVVMDGYAEETPGISALQTLHDQGRAWLDAGEDSAAGLQVDEEQTVEIVFTSGTTSRSKMVMLSQRAVMQNLCDSTQYVCFYKTVFCSLPFYHAYGLNCAVLNSFLRGAHLYINGNLRTTMRDLHLAQPDTMLAVPLMLEAIHNQIWLNAERAGKAGSLRKLMKLSTLGRKVGLSIGRGTLDGIREKALGNLRLIICGGAHLSREIAEEFDLLGVQVLQGYGISECAPLISVNCNYANKMGSVGLPLPSMEVRLVQEEVWVKGPSVMQGYYNEPDQTAEAMEDGWFKTGDLGYQDKDGFLYLTGRKKNLVVFKNGKKVSPERLENMLSPIPLVKEVVVYGTVNGSAADDVKLTASIYPDPERTKGMSSFEVLDLLQKEINQINTELPTYQQIQMVTIREKEFAKTGTKKIKRYAE